MMTVEQFRTQVEVFLGESGMAPTRFGRDAVGDPNFVFQIRAGRAPGLRLAERALAFIAARRASLLEERAA